MQPKMNWAAYVMLVVLSGILVFLLVAEREPEVIERVIERVEYDTSFVQVTVPPDTTEIIKWYAKYITLRDTVYDLRVDTVTKEIIIHDATGNEVILPSFTATADTITEDYEFKASYFFPENYFDIYIKTSEQEIQIQNINKTIFESVKLETPWYQSDAVKYGSGMAFGVLVGMALGGN